MKAFVLPLIVVAIGAAQGGYLNRPTSSYGNAPSPPPSAGPREGWTPTQAAPREGWTPTQAAPREGWAPPSAGPRDGWASNQAAPRDGWASNQAPPRDGWAPSPAVQPSYTPGPVVPPVHASAHASAAPRVHEIHTHSGRQQIRLEEYTRPAQVIRVHEAPQGPPEIVKVHAPAEKAALIRVISKGGGPAHVERVVHRAPGPQIIDVHKPAPAPARIVQVVRGAGPAPRIEFHYEESPVHEVHVASAPADHPLPAPVPLPAFVAAPQTITLSSPALTHSGPVEVTSHVLPARAGSHGPHTIQTRYVETSSSHAHSPRPVVTVSAHPTSDFGTASHGSFHSAPRSPLPSPNFGSAPSFNPEPLPPAKPIGNAYEVGDHIKIIKKSHH